MESMHNDSLFNIELLAYYRMSKRHNLQHVMPSLDMDQKVDVGCRPVP